MASVCHALGRGAVRRRAEARHSWSDGMRGPGRAVTGGMHWGVRSVCAGGVRALHRRGLHCRVSAGRGGRWLASGEEASVWVVVCLPGVRDGHLCVR
jgi:hypothetical protein